MPNKLDRAHISDMDKFLHGWDDKHPEKSASQQVEINKFKKLNQTRDEKTQDAVNDQSDEVWSGF